MAEPGEPRWREGRAALRLIFQSKLVVPLVCGLTFVASLQFLLGGPSLDSLDVLSALNTRPTKLWHLLVAFQPVLWLASLLSVFGDARRNGPVWPGPRSERLAVGFHAVFIFTLALLPAIIAPLLLNPSVLPADVDALTEVPHLREKMFILNCLGSVVGVMLVCGMLSVHIQLIGQPLRTPSSGEETAEESLEGEVVRYQRLRAQLKRCLGFAGGVISAALLSISAFNNVLAQAIPTQPGVFPATATLGFGIYFTGFLALLYLPAAKTLSEAGEALAARLVRRSPGARATWKQWSEEQRAVRTWLGLEGSPLQELQQGLALLSPFIASLSTLLFGTGR